MRNSELLSMTVQPAWAARGACALLTSEPAANRAMSQPAKSKCSRFLTLSSLPLSPKSMTSPVERADDRRHFVHRELPFGEDVQHLPPDIARRSDDCDPITHSKFSVPRMHLVRGVPFAKTRATATVEIAELLLESTCRRAPRSSRDAPFEVKEVFVPATTVSASPTPRQDPVRTITNADADAALREGWGDFMDMRGDLIFVGLIYVLVGVVAATAIMGGLLLALLFLILAGIGCLVRSPLSVSTRWRAGGRAASIELAAFPRRPKAAQRR